ncbi:FAD/NAD(P)-binding protein [Klebsiella aerogenes]
MESIDKLSYNLKKIAIVGAGASAALLMEALSKRILNQGHNFSITIFEKRLSLGKGLAYSGQSDNLIINTPINTMSVCEYDNDDFRKWLSVNYELTQDANISRKIYGQYLEDKINQCITLFEKNGCIVNINHCKVDSVSIDENYVLNFHGRSEFFDICIITTGGGVSNLALQPKDKASRVLSIFDEKELSLIKKSHIAIVGSGQSAVDACIMLEELNSGNHYTLVSRSGVLPRVKSNLYKKQLTSTLAHTDLKNKPMINLCSDVIESIKWKMDDVHVMQPSPASFRSMDTDLRRAAKHYPSWQDSMTKITPYINDVWLNFTSEEKKYFQDKWQKNLYFLRSAIMPESAKRFLDIYKSGRIGIVWGEYKLTAVDSAFLLTTNNCHFKIDYVINATGISPTAHCQIMKDEIDNGHIILNDKNGFCIDGNSMRLLNKNERPHRGLYSMGYPTQGAVMIANSIELLRQCAVKIATHISQTQI